MQSTWLPLDVCEAIEKKIRIFVWGSSNESPSLALVKWDAVKSPLKEGGLGFRDLRCHNQALVTKLGSFGLTALVFGGVLVRVGMLFVMAFVGKSGMGGILIFGGIFGLTGMLLS
ncbi:hypothetical protein V6N11_041928 [Hibiscus sabdariffa]|uniref:Uncharacterized protein n=2 Tax=Hibiscus sabdariffa TaxID=183260 RepID=A0ABR2BUR6_9ROSI